MCAAVVSSPWCSRGVHVCILRQVLLSATAVSTSATLLSTHSYERSFRHIMLLSFSLHSVLACCHYCVRYSVVSNLRCNCLCDNVVFVVPSSLVRLLRRSPTHGATVMCATAVSGVLGYRCVHYCGLRRVVLRLCSEVRSEGEVLTSCSVLQSPTPGSSTALNTAVSDTLWYLPLCSLLLSPTHGATVVFSTAVSHHARSARPPLGGVSPFKVHYSIAFKLRFVGRGRRAQNKRSIPLES